MAHALRTQTLPALDLWSPIIAMMVPNPKHRMKVRALEDNSAAIQIVASGMSPAMRHLGRTHRVNLAWVHEVIQQDDITLQYIETQHQAAELFTKGFGDKLKFQHAVQTIGMAKVDPSLVVVKTTKETSHVKKKNGQACVVTASRYRLEKPSCANHVCQFLSGCQEHQACQ